MILIWTLIRTVPWSAVRPSGKDSNRYYLNDYNRECPKGARSLINRMPHSAPMSNPY